MALKIKTKTVLFFSLLQSTLQLIQQLIHGDFLSRVLQELG